MEKENNQDMDEINKVHADKNQDQDCYTFKCALCDVSEIVHYKGKKPPFSRNIMLKYPGYIMKDPFSPPGKGEILVIGADCCKCNRQICISKECSLFYNKSFCLDCVKSSIDSFPAEIKNKIIQLKKK